MTTPELLDVLADLWELQHGTDRGFGFGSGEALGRYHAWAEAVTTLRALAALGDARLVHTDPAQLRNMIDRLTPAVHRQSALIIRLDRPPPPTPDLATPPPPFE